MENKRIFIFAFKNIKRNKRRSALNVVGLTLIVALVIYCLAFYRGTYQDMLFENFIKYNSSHFKIHKKGVDDIEEMVNKKMLIKNSDEIKNELKKIKEIKGYSFRIKTYGFISNGKEKFPVILIGCNPLDEKKVLVAGDSIFKGNFLEGNPDEIVIGKKLAEILNLKLNDTCLIYTNTTFSLPNLSILKIKGIIFSSSPEFDKNTVFLKIEKLQEIIDEKNAVNEILIKINNTKETDKIEKILKDKLKNCNLQIYSWKYYGSYLVKDAQGDAIFYYILIGILILISVSTITSTISVSIFERIKEIGTLRALGWQKKDILKLILGESCIMGIFGSIFGTILGFIFVFLNYHFTYKYEVAFINMPLFEIKTSPSFYDFAFGIILGLITSIVAGFFPSRRASNMNIIEALYVIR